MSDAGATTGAPEDPPGPVEASVRRSLDVLGKLDEGVRGPLSQMAVRMARAYDQYQGSDLAKLARLNMELRQTLTRLAEVTGDGDEAEGERLGTPVWPEVDVPTALRDAAQPGSADVGAAVDGGGDAAS